MDILYLPEGRYQLTLIDDCARLPLPPALHPDRQRSRARQGD
ncbi:MAG TPA: hypothetical protein VJM69_05700 [Dehalococcoidia bacterium]|nr:hypothetical protein [Dehalococcoidia bacterium]